MNDVWPALPFSEWKATCKTLHMWTQIVGKIRLSLTPWINHSWHVTLYVTARGLTTSPIYLDSRALQIDFDFIDHELRIETGGTCFRTSAISGGAALEDKGWTRGSASLRGKTISLAPKSVAAFYQEVMSALRELDFVV